MKKRNSCGISDKRARYLKRRKKRLSTKRKVTHQARKAAAAEAPSVEKKPPTSVAVNTCEVRGPPLGRESHGRGKEDPEDSTTSLSTYLGFIAKFGSMLAKGAIVCLAAFGLFNVGSGSSDSAFTLSFKKDGAIVDLTVDVRSSEKTLADKGITLEDIERIRSIASGIISTQGLGQAIPPGMTLVDDEALDEPVDEPQGLLELYLNRFEIVEP